MLQRKETPSAVAAQIRKALKDGGSAEHATGVQWFFKEEIKSHGWYTGDLRRAVRRLRQEILQDHDLEFLVNVADKLFSGPVLEEKIVAVFLLEKTDAQFGDREFRVFESWLDRIGCWADHDALGPLPDRADDGEQAGTGERCFPLGEVSGPLAPTCGLRGFDSGARAKMFFPEIVRLSDFLLC